MLKALKNLFGEKPRGGFVGWKYPKKLKGGKYFEFKDEYQRIEDLVRHVRKFERANGFTPILGLQDILEDFFCRKCSYYRQFCVEDIMTVKQRVQGVIEGGKAILKIKAKSVSNSLKVLELSEVKKNVDRCRGCSLNRFASEIGHEPMYVHDLEKAYGVKDIKEVEVEGHSDLGKCDGCDCKMMSKVFLHVDNYGKPLLRSIYKINNMLQANIEGGKNCWQLEGMFHKEHIEIMKKNRKVTKQNLKDWGYL